MTDNVKYLQIVQSSAQITRSGSLTHSLTPVSAQTFMMADSTVLCEELNCILVLPPSLLCMS